MAGELSFFELGVEDPERARAFYSELFGWTFEPGPGGSGGFSIGTPNTPGGVHGSDAGGGPYVFFRVDDLDAAKDRVTALGGSIETDLGEDADSVARFGRFALCRDDQGSAFGLHQPPSA